MKKSKIGAAVITLILGGRSLWALTPGLEAARNESGVKFGGEYASMLRDATVPAVPAPSADKALSGAQAAPLEWVTIAGGAYTMGEAGMAAVDDQPYHKVTIKTFAMSKEAVTVEQYAECVAKGKCTEPKTGGVCNWGVAGREHQPANCVNWFQAGDYAKFKGVRLASESEWEYASYAPGLSDMAGGVWQWVQDAYQYSYKGLPADGSAFGGGDGTTVHVLRGGSSVIEGGKYLRGDSNRIGIPGALKRDFIFHVVKPL